MRSVKRHHLAPIKILSILLLPLASFSCSGGGGGGNSSVPAGVLNMSGTWKGTYSTSLVPTSDMTIALAQEGNEFSGTYEADSSSGSITGTVSGDTISFDLDPNEDCPGDFDGCGSVKDRSLTLTFTGTDCLGAHRNGRATLSKK